MVGLKLKRKKQKDKVNLRQRVRTRKRVKPKRNLKKGKGKKTVRIVAIDSKSRAYPYPPSKTKNKKSLGSEFKPSTSSIATSNEIALKIAEFQRRNGNNIDQSDDEEEVENFLLKILKMTQTRPYLAFPSKLLTLFKKINKNTLISDKDFINLLKSPSNAQIITYAKTKI